MSHNTDEVDHYYTIETHSANTKQIIFVTLYYSMYESEIETNDFST